MFTMKSFIIFLLAAVSIFSENLSPLKKFHFKSRESKILPGNSGEKAKGFNCSGTVNPEDQAGDFALLSSFYQNGCYTDGRYNSSNFKVDLGTAETSDGKTKYPAVRIHPPEKKAQDFLASHHNVYYKSHDKNEVNIYHLSDEGVMTKSFKTNAGITASGFQKAEGFLVSQISSPQVYVFMPVSEKFSLFQTLSKDAEGAKVFDEKGIELDRYRFSIQGNIYDTANGFTAGPESHSAVYGRNRQFFTSPLPNGIAVIWQDEKTDDVYASILSEKLDSHRQVKLSSTANYQLAAATADPSGNIYHMLIEKPAKSFSARKVSVFKSSADGKALKTASLDASEKGLNITKFGEDTIASMVYSNEKLGMIISRTMHKSSDGLNHQGAIGIVLDAKTLTLLHNHGQTSGHSFGNILDRDSEGKFLGIDLGDNYPRGVHLHRFDEKSRSSRVVYTFKTEHGDRAMSPAGRNYPVYREISGNGKTYYQWSNDNRTYTELAGIHETQSGIAVFFAGEPDSSGKAINNSRAQGYITDARNLGMVLLKKDFKGKDAVISSGEDEKGGFYSFGGTFSEQENKGIKWLTGYSNPEKENVSRAKTAELKDGSVLAVWEVWTKNSYVRTEMSRINPGKQSASKPVSLGSGLRLS
ncbi:MAG TPA: hypothetical protein PKK05_25995, partial [Leptospiraceae bacterium]|nr:hypothetical protein [Leptospiraceae bacterium]